MTIRQVVTGYQDILTFGKFKGKTVRWIANEEPSYIIWLDEEKIVTFPDEVLDNAISDDANNSPPEDYFLRRD